MFVLTNPFFWAFVGMFGLLGGIALVSGIRLGQNAWIGFITIYLADILFTLGFAVMFRSIIGIALVPICWLAFLLLVLVEEASLERVLGQRYLDYKDRVKGRILPGLPI